MNRLPASARPNAAPARRALVVLCLAGLGLSAGPTSATDAAKQRCDQLRGQRVVATKSLRVVRRPFTRIYRKGGTKVIGRDFFACARPRGPVRKVASDGREYVYPGTTKTSPVDSTAAFIRQTAGTFLILATQSANLTGDYAEKSSVVFDAATGKRYRFFHALMSPGGRPKPETGPPSVVKLNALGQLAGIFVNPADAQFEYSDPKAGQVEVIAFNAQGTRTVLDQAPVADIPTASLTLTGSTVGWTNAGKPKTAAIR